MQSGLGAIVLLSVGWCLSHLSGWAVDVRMLPDAVQVCARHRSAATPKVCLDHWTQAMREALRAIPGHGRPSLIRR